MKKFWIKKGIMFLCFFIVAMLAFGLLVMGLWNAILPAVLGVKTITYLQALGILLLSKILFGGFKGGWRGGRRHQPRWIEMKEKFAGMTPEEREKFKTEWKNRCSGRWGKQPEDNSTTTKMASE